MYSFLNDYSEGAHPDILAALQSTNMEQTCGYGLDPYCEQAAETIRRKFQADRSDIHFAVGGTQVNLLIIHALLRSYEAVISAETAHVSLHETGAIEVTGHKVCTVPSPDGKLTPELVESVLNAHSSEHMVRPRLVYISDTTELGTLYTKAELTALHDFCREQDLLLFLDGARLGSALTAEDNDLSPADLPRLTDVFTIGATKNGALFGEAIVLSAQEVKPHFRWYMKQRGAILAKGRLLGIQFQILFRSDLYFDLARHANAMAAKLRDGLLAQGYSFAAAPQSNQLFPILPGPVVQSLHRTYQFDADRLMGDGSLCVRLVTSWATPEQAVDDFLRDLAACSKK